MPWLQINLVVYVTQGRKSIRLREEVSVGAHELGCGRTHALGCRVYVKDVQRHLAGLRILYSTDQSQVHLFALSESAFDLKRCEHLAP
jgi:hypothetical protein